MTRAAAAEWDEKENFSTRSRKVIKGVTMVHFVRKQGNSLADKLTSVQETFEKRFFDMKNKADYLNLGRRERGHTKILTQEISRAVIVNPNFHVSFGIECCTDGHTGGFSITNQEN